METTMLQSCVSQLHVWWLFTNTHTHMHTHAHAHAHAHAHTHAHVHAHAHIHTHTHVQVGTNGIISFGAPFQHWSPNPFPTTDYWTRTSYVVAPYWSDVDTRMEGTVCYEYHEADLIEDTTTIDRVSTFIRENTGTDFSGLWMLVAEWNSVHPYPHGVANTATDLSPGYEEFLQLVSLERIEGAHGWWSIALTLYQP